MVYSQNFIANFFVYIANIIFFISFIPQIFINYKLKTTKGLSDLFILGYLISSFSDFCFIFSSNLPFVYRITSPFYLFFIIILVIQRFYYFDYKKDRKFLFLCAINILFFLILIFLFLNYSNKIGWFLGWVPIFISLIKKIPQILKIYVKKTVFGFSLLFILINFTGYLFEIVGALILELPVQVIITDFKGVFVYLIFLFQFVLYKNNSKEGFSLYA